MKPSLNAFLLLAALASATAQAAAPVAAPADAPAGSKGLCKDGSYSSSAEKSGACRGHKGIKAWYGETATAAPMTKVGATTAPAPAAVTTAPTGPSSPPARKVAAAPMQQAPGGGAGQVWANEESKVYHCSGDRYYGKTKKGMYMSEADAKTKGFHADHGKACT